MPETNTEVKAEQVVVGDLIYDRLLAGTHNQRVLVQWVGDHKRRSRIYLAGLEEGSGNPVTVAYDYGADIKVFRA